MKWCVLLLALAGVVFPAYATTSPPVNVSITITSSGSTSCDFGPNYTGAFPAAATQAGFTHCAANYDFTQTQQWTDNVGGATHQWSNLSSWLNCSNFVASPYMWRYVGGGVACGDGIHQVITTDSGVQTFAMSYLASDFNSGKFGNTFQTAGNGTSHPWPDEMYAEIVVRSTTNATGCTDGCPYFDMSTYTDVPNHPCFFGSDMEWDTNSSTVTVGSSIWNNAPCGTESGSGIGPTIYGSVPTNSSVNTNGILITGDDHNNYSVNTYWEAGSVNGLPASAWRATTGAVSVVPTADTSIFNTRMFQYIAEGVQSNGQGTNWNLTQHTTYIQRITLWMCPGYASSGCYTDPVITTHP